MSTAPSQGKQKLSSYLFNLAFPPFDELKFVIMLVVGFVLCLVNKQFGHAASLQLQDIRSFSVLVVLVLILLIIASSKKLPDELKAMSGMFYYGFFALIAYSALDHRNSQVHGDTLIAHINLLLVYSLLIIAIVRGVLAYIAARSHGLNKLTARSFRDTQYTPTGFLIGIIAGVLSTVIMGQFYHDPAQTALFSFVCANVFVDLSAPLIHRRLKY